LEVVPPSTDVLFPLLAQFFAGFALQCVPSASRPGALLFATVAVTAPGHFLSYD
jgi:hypothetical protein